MQVCQDYVSRLASLHGWLASNLASSLSAVTKYKRSAHPSISMYKLKGFDAVAGVPWCALPSMLSDVFLPKSPDPLAQLCNSVDQLKSVKKMCPLKVWSRKSS